MALFHRRQAYKILQLIVPNQRFFLPLWSFFKKLWRHHQQAKRFPIFFVAFGMVRAVRPQNSAAVLAVQLLEPTEPAVDVHVVDQEISESVKRNTNADKQDPEIGRKPANHITNHAWNGKNKKKAIVFFKKTFFLVLGQMVVFVPAPKKTVHHEFVCEPGHEFHADVCGQGD